MNGRDHGGGLDAAVARWGGQRDDWLDLSTGINPVPYPVPEFTAQDWGALPDAAAFLQLEQAARQFWNVPDGVGILAAPGASALIARIPFLASAGRVSIPGPTYNEHAAAFQNAGWEVCGDAAPAQVVVHPNNPDGRFRDVVPGGGLTVIDESFCDIAPARSQIALATKKNTIILKSFGKFWGLAGARLGFAIGDPALIAALSEALGPWQVGGPTLRLGAIALADQGWAEATRARLKTDAARLDAMVPWPAIGGTSLFRLYDTKRAETAQSNLAQHHVWSRIFPYSTRWLRLGLPGSAAQWAQLEGAL